MSTEVLTPEEVEDLRWASYSEDDLLNQVREIMKAYGFWVFHDQDSRRNEAGLTDIIAIREPRVIFAELKTMKGVATDIQRNVMRQLRGSNQETYLWRPRHLDRIDEICAMQERPVLTIPEEIELDLELNHQLTLEGILTHWGITRRHFEDMLRRYRWLRELWLKRHDSLDGPDPRTICPNCGRAKGKIAKQCRDCYLGVREVYQFCAGCGDQFTRTRHNYLHRQSDPMVGYCKPSCAGAVRRK